MTNATTGAIELAEAEGVDIEEVSGSGLNGRITKADVEKFIDGEEPYVTPYRKDVADQVNPAIEDIRRDVASHIQEAQTKEQKGIAALLRGVPVKDVASQQGVSYGTALYWLHKVKKYPEPAKRGVDSHAAPLKRDSGCR